MKELKQRELNVIAQSLLTSPFMACVVVNTEGIITFINQPYLDWINIKKEDAVGKHVHEVTPDSSFTEVFEDWKGCAG